MSSPMNRIPTSLRAPSTDSSRSELPTWMELVLRFSSTSSVEAAVRDSATSIAVGSWTFTLTVAVAVPPLPSLTV